MVSPELIDVGDRYGVPGTPMVSPELLSPELQTDIAQFNRRYRGAPTPRIKTL
jgi:hypothetical protein